MPSSPIPNLYQELIDRVIDFIPRNEYLSTEEKQVFAGCTLVSRAFLLGAQRHLFSCVYFVGGWNRKWRCQGLLEILRRNPHLAGYVQELYLAPALEYPSWIAEDPDFTEIMQLVTKSKGSFRKLSWQGDFNIYPGLVDSLSKFLQSFISPFITSLNLLNVADFPNRCMFAIWPNLTEIILFCSPVELTFNSFHKNSDPPFPKLRRMSFFTPPIQTSYICPVPTLSNLKSISITVDEKWDPKFDNLMGACSNSLEELRILAFDDYRYTPKFDGFINLQTFPHLRILDLHVRLRIDVKIGLAAVCDSLSTMSSNNLESMNLKIYLGFDHDPLKQLGPDGPETLLDAGWDIFCSKLSRIISGRPFQLSIYVVYEVGNGQWKKEWIFGPNVSYRWNQLCEAVHENCEVTLETLFRDKLSSLIQTPKVDISLDHLFSVRGTRGHRGLLHWFSPVDGEHRAAKRSYTVDEWGKSLWQNEIG